MISRARVAKHQDGITLTEVLVAVVVTAIGLLGVARMQTISVRYNHSAYLRSQAASVADSLIERMRVNRDAAIAGSYNAALTDAPPVAANCIGPGANCSPAQLAAFDVRLWLLSTQNLLPAGDGSINVDATVTPPTVTVTVQWDDSKGELPAVSFVTTSSLQ